MTLLTLTADAIFDVLEIEMRRTPWHMTQLILIYFMTVSQSGQAVFYFKFKLFKLHALKRLHSSVTLFKNVIYHTQAHVDGNHR